jgi:hypothetical protein
MAFTMEFGTGFEMGRVVTRAGTVVASNSDHVIPLVSSTIKHTGGYAFRVQTKQFRKAHVMFYRPEASNDIYVSVWGYYDEYASKYPFICFMVDGAKIAELRWDLGNYWDAYVNDVKVADGTVAVPLNTWQHIQIHFTCGASGVFETIIEGQEDISYSGNTQPGASDQVEAVGLGGDAVGTGGYDFYCDDFCFGTGGWPGDVRFDPLYVDGDVAGECDWEPSAGSDHYALVDEVPPSSTDYIYARSDLGERLETPGTWDDTDGLGNVVKNPFAVVVWADVRKQDGNQDDRLSLVQSDGSNEVAQAAESLLTSYENRWYIREAAPDGGEWTTAKVNTLVIGLEADVEEVE